MGLIRAKTKRRLKHLVLKKKLVSRRTSRRVMRAATASIGVLAIGALGYSITSTRPTRAVVGVSEGRFISAKATPTPDPSAAANGMASWYALGLRQPDALTCASRTHLRGTRLEVTNLRNGRRVVCLVNDYGPAAWTGRIIDLSRGSFVEIEALGRGTTPVSVRPLSMP